MVRFLIILALFVHSQALRAQEADIVLSQFFATQLDENVFLRWTITAGNTCQDTYVERSTRADSGFERIGLIGGICGSPYESITYEFYDTVPLPNQTSYYRLQLGQYGFTTVKTVEFILFNDQGFLLAPNPFRESTRLVYENPDKTEHNLVITDTKGIIVREITDTTGEIYISGINLSSGVYHFSMVSGGKVILSGKLIKME